MTRALRALGAPRHERIRRAGVGARLAHLGLQRAQPARTRDRHAIGGAVAVLWLNAERFLPLFPRMFLPESQLSTADQKRMGKKLTSEQLQQPYANVDPDAKSATDSSRFGQWFHFFASKERATGLVPGKA